MNQEEQETNSIILNAPAYDPWIEYPIQQKKAQERRRFQRCLDVVNISETAMTHR